MNPEDLSALTAVKNDFRYRWLSIREGWKGYSTPEVIKQWKPISDYSPKWIHLFPTVAIFSCSYKFFHHFSTFLSKRPFINLLPTVVTTSVGYKLTRDFITFVSFRSFF